MFEVQFGYCLCSGVDGLDLCEPLDQLADELAQDVLAHAPYVQDLFVVCLVVVLVACHTFVGDEG